MLVTCRLAQSMNKLIVLDHWLEQDFRGLLYKLSSLCKKKNKQLSKHETSDLDAKVLKVLPTTHLVHQVDENERKAFWLHRIFIGKYQNLYFFAWCPDPDSFQTRLLRHITHVLVLGFDCWVEKPYYRKKNFTGLKWDSNPGSYRQHGHCCKRGKPLHHL